MRHQRIYGLVAMLIAVVLTPPVLVDVIRTGDRWQADRPI